MITIQQLNQDLTLPFYHSCLDNGMEYLTFKTDNSHTNKGFLQVPTENNLKTGFNEFYTLVEQCQA